MHALVRAGGAVRELVAAGGDSPLARHLTRGAAVAAHMAAGPAASQLRKLGRSRLAVQVRLAAAWALRPCP